MTGAHTGHMTFVPGTFASGVNEPACLFSTSLVLFFFSCQTKSPLIIAEYKREEAERKKKKKKINGSILEEDNKLLGFNYFPLVAL